MTQHHVQEGKAPFQIPSREAPCETYYKIYGNLHGGQVPLVVLHGGPGSGHEYMEPYKDLHTRFGIPILFYDQIGCGSSTRLPETLGDRTFWQPSLFVAELDNLLEHLKIDRPNGPGYDILGHSWGGSLACAFSSRQPPKLRRLILAGANASAQHLKRNIWTLKERLPVEHSKAIDTAVETGDFKDPAYLAALSEFMQTFLCRGRPYPPPELAANQRNQLDVTVRQTMHGLSPFLYDGSLSTWSNIPLLRNIAIPTLVQNAEFDTAQDHSTEPFFEGIPRVRWVTLPGASHMPHLDSVETREKVVRLFGRFLRPEVEEE